MIKFHYEILSPEQSEMLPFVKVFKKDFLLVGGTAIALYLGHRKSIDFDYFAMWSEELEVSLCETLILKWNKIMKNWLSIKKVYENYNQINMLINWVKFTLYSYPYDVPEYIGDEMLRVPSLLDLWAMKAFAIWQRAKRKDYVDMYFILQKTPFSKIATRTKNLFGWMFNQRLFITQIWYFDDINYEEKVEFMPWYEVDDDVVKNFLLEESLKIMRE